MMTRVLCACGVRAHSCAPWVAGVWKWLRAVAQSVRSVGSLRSQNEEDQDNRQRQSQRDQRRLADPSL